MLPARPGRRRSCSTAHDRGSRPSRAAVASSPAAPRAQRPGSGSGRATTAATAQAAATAPAAHRSDPLSPVATRAATTAAPTSTVVSAPRARAARRAATPADRADRPGTPWATPMGAKLHQWNSVTAVWFAGAMRVAAIGDAHLGRSYYSFTAEGGVNQRERDFEEAFERAVDAALGEAPDLVCLLGDIFDHPRPTYRSFRVAQRALARLREHGVAVVVISGNHDTPRLPGTGSPYSALADTFPDVRFATRLQYERFEFPGLVVHAVPQMLTVDKALAGLDAAAAARSGDRTNLLLTHPR